MRQRANLIPGGSCHFLEDFSHLNHLWLALRTIHSTKVYDRLIPLKHDNLI